MSKQKFRGKEEKKLALSQVAEFGVAATSRRLGISRNTLNKWIANSRFEEGLEPSKPRRSPHSQETRMKALALVDIQGVGRTAEQLKIPAPTLKNWIRKGARGGSAVVYPDDVVHLGVELAEEFGATLAAKILDIPQGSVYGWSRKYGKPRKIRNFTAYSLEFKKRALARAEEVGRLKTARELGIDDDLLRRWAVGRTKQVRTKYEEEFKKAVVESVQAIGVRKTAESFTIKTDLVRRFFREAGFRLRRPPGESVVDDLQLKWVDKQCPGLVVWRDFAVEWLSGERSAITGKLAAIRLFIKKYLHENNLPSAPELWLSRAGLFPDFFLAACPQTDYGKTCSNYVYNFVQWVLRTHFSHPDDHGRPTVLPIFHNPIAWQEIQGGGGHPETVYTPLPYGYIEELRGMLVQGPNFADWTWAQGALGAEPGELGAVASDWFEVDESKVDKRDPDCVFRTRLRARKSGGDVLEMWSPVRWVALLVKLILPLRTFQVRMLDSGEADTWRFSSNAPVRGWFKNPSPLRSGTDRRPWAQGVIRRYCGFDKNTVSTAVPDAIVFVNTNKTADRGKFGPEKGYDFPWIGGGHLNSDLFYWIEKLIKWQEKYNPISRKTEWSELDRRHVAKKSDIALAGYPPTCFLFRLPEGKLGERHLPVSDGQLNIPWFKLLRALEERLSARKEVCADGSKIELTVPGSDRTTRFPLHSLRVSLLTSLAVDGKVSLEVLQKIAGHYTARMAIYYQKPGALHVVQTLEEGVRLMGQSAQESIVRFLRTAEHKQLVEDALANNSATLATAIPAHPAARNVAGWMMLHLGLCLVGGNTSPLEAYGGLGGCYNGGPNVGTTSQPKYAPVPGGARNCVRCRWFVTHPAYLPMLVAHWNVLMYHATAARNEFTGLVKSIDALKKERFAAENLGEPWPQDKATELAAEERRYGTAVAHFVERFHDLEACLSLVERCAARLSSDSGDTSEGQGALVAVGSLRDIKIAIEPLDSEVLQLATVCDAVETCPDMSATGAGVRLGQLLDSALVREGKPPFFLTLPAAEQSKCATQFFKTLSSRANAESESVGSKQVSSLLDARASLSEAFGIDISGLLPRSASMHTVPFTALHA